MDQNENGIKSVPTNLLKEDEEWRRKCRCLRTSEKLKEVLAVFPAPPPPTPAWKGCSSPLNVTNTCISAYCTRAHRPSILQSLPTIESEKDTNEMVKKDSWSPRKIVSELVQLVQLSVTATAVGMYYLIYCYMQLIYYALSSALYFHNADGPMKVTIGVVTITSLVVAFNLLWKLERLIGIM